MRLPALLFLALCALVWTTRPVVAGAPVDAAAH